MVVIQAVQRLPPNGGGGASKPTNTPISAPSVPMLTDSTAMLDGVAYPGRPSDLLPSSDWKHWFGRE